MLGDLIENAAKYGGGSVFVTIAAEAAPAPLAATADKALSSSSSRTTAPVPETDRVRIFDRGVRLNSGKPGAGLGLAIVRDVAEIYEGTVSLEESKDLGGCW